MNRRVKKTFALVVSFAVVLSSCLIMAIAEDGLGILVPQSCAACGQTHDGDCAPVSEPEPCVSCGLVHEGDCTPAEPELCEVCGLTAHEGDCTPVSEPCATCGLTHEGECTPAEVVCAGCGKAAHDGDCEQEQPQVCEQCGQIHDGDCASETEETCAECGKPAHEGDCEAEPPTEPTEESADVVVSDIDVHMWCLRSCDGISHQPNKAFYESVRLLFPTDDGQKDTDKDGMIDWDKLSKADIAAAKFVPVGAYNALLVLDRQDTREIPEAVTLFTQVDALAINTTASGEDGAGIEQFLSENFWESFTGLRALSCRGEEWFDAKNFALTIPTLESLEIEENSFNEVSGFALNACEKLSKLTIGEKSFTGVETVKLVLSKDASRPDEDKLFALHEQFDLLDRFPSFRFAEIDSALIIGGKPYIQRQLTAKSVDIKTSVSFNPYELVEFGYISKSTPETEDEAQIERLNRSVPETLPLTVTETGEAGLFADGKPAKSGTTTFVISLDGTSEGNPSAITQSIAAYVNMNPMTAIEMTPDPLYVKVGDKVTVAVSLTPLGAYNTDYQIEIADSSIIGSVDGMKNQFIGKKAGTTKIKVSSREDPRVFDEISVSVTPRETWSGSNNNDDDDEISPFMTVDTANTVRLIKKAAKDGVVKVDVEEYYLVSQVVFQTLALYPEKTLVLDGGTYEWAFKGSDIYRMSNLPVLFNSRAGLNSPNRRLFAKQLKTEHAMNVYTEHTGNFPGKGTLKLRLPSENRGSDKTYHFYHYNWDKREFEMIKLGTQADDKGYIALSVKSAGDYILTLEYLTADRPIPPAPAPTPAPVAPIVSEPVSSQEETSREEEGRPEVSEPDKSDEPEAPAVTQPEPEEKKGLSSTATMALVLGSVLLLAVIGTLIFVRIRNKAN